MAVFRAFRAVRPVPGLAPHIAALPYDVMNSEEAGIEAKNNPYSFLHVDKAEIDIDPSIDIYDKKVYEKARENLCGMIEKGFLQKDQKESLYIYRQTMDGHVQVGLTGCVSVDDYVNGTIRRHENTRIDKELDRTNHIKYCSANTGPIFLIYKGKKEISRIIEAWMEENPPVYDFVSEDKVRHTVWAVADPLTVQRLASCFAEIDSLYIADGHHRAAAAVKVAEMKRKEKPRYTGNEEFNYFLGVLFPDTDIRIMDYNRVIWGLNGHSNEAFLEELNKSFVIEILPAKYQYKPDKKHTFGMYLDHKWYKLTARAGIYDPKDIISSLDVSVLQNSLLEPILGIKDPRTDNRIEFIGGIRGLDALEKKVDTGASVAFSMFPASTEDLIAASDSGKIMPPKSTWFEPKLRSGLFVHDLES